MVFSFHTIIQRSSYEYHDVGLIICGNGYQKEKDEKKNTV